MRIIFALLPIFISCVATGQKIDTLIYKYEPPDTVKYWDFTGNVGFNFQAVGFKDWSKGGTPSLSLASNINIIALYSRDGTILENKLDAGYGMIMERGDNDDNGLKKNDDFIILITKYGKQLVKKWYLEGIVDFRTQFAQGFAEEQNINGDYPLVSKFLSPATLSPSLGLGYKKQKLSFTLSPISGKLTFVTNDSLTYIPANGVDPGEHFRSEAGASIALSDERSIMENVFLRYNIRIFTAYNQFNFRHTDLYGEFYTRFKINKFLSSNFNFRVVYDDNYDPNENGEYPFQINYVFDFGITYDFWRD